MPGERAQTKKSGPVKPGAAKAKHAMRAKRKETRAVKASNSVVHKFIVDLEEEEETDMRLALVTATQGGGRFLAKDVVSGEDLTVQVSKKLFTKKAKHRNAVLPIAVREGSYVIIDVANRIKGVATDAEAAHIRTLLHVVEVESNNLFNRGAPAAKSGNRRSSKGSKRSSKGSKRSEVNLNDL